MAIVYAAVIPHAPLLLPTVAKKHTRLSSVTRAKIAEIAGELYASQPDTIIIFTPHGSTIRGSIIFNLADQLRGQLVQFGDDQTTVQVRGATGDGHRLKELAEDAQVPVVLQTLSELDYGTTIPTWFFNDIIKTVRILPISVADTPSIQLIKFCQVLNEYAQSQKRRFAIIASADFSRRTVSKTATFNKPTPEEKKVAEALTVADASTLLPLAATSDTCGILPTIALISALRGLPAHGTIRSFEAPFAVGLMIATIDIKA